MTYGRSLIGECQGIPLTLTADPVPESCVGLQNGSVTLTGIGGVPTYTYSIEGIFHGQVINQQVYL